MKAFIAAAVAAGALTASSAAHAVNIDFHFYGERFAQGDVSGTIFDLAANGSSTPDRIIFIDQLPSYWQMFGIWGGGVDLRSPDISGQFDLVGGQLTGGSIFGTNPSNGDAFFWDFDDQEVSATVNGQTTLAYFSDHITEGGSQPDYTSYPTPAPEPSSWVTMLAGIAWIGGLSRAGRAKRRGGRVTV